MYEPDWFKADEVLIVNAQTRGINKDGHEQYTVDLGTGQRSTDINDQLADYVDQVAAGEIEEPHVSYVSRAELSNAAVLVPKYYDRSSLDDFEAFISEHAGVSSIALGDLVEDEHLLVFKGHGSPSVDQRVGTVPYIKVSDLRAGSVNINPTNLIPEKLAQKYWKGNSSGLQAYDLISPERASKNIGEFCVLMPGQERVVLTKEVICVRATDSAPFDQFFLMWALSLGVVRHQWDRIVFMQTNREDVGERVLEIRIPMPESRAVADEYAEPFKNYYLGIEKLRSAFSAALKRSGNDHHIFLE